MRAIEVRHEAGDRFRITVGRHEVVVDQPAAGDAGPTPTELFVASLASCAAFYARRFLERRDLADASLRVAAACAMSADHSRVSEISLRLTVPVALEPPIADALRRVVDGCTVHSSIRVPPTLTLELEGMSEVAAAA